VKELRTGIIALLSLLGLFVVASLLSPNLPHVAAQNAGQSGAPTVSKALTPQSATGVMVVTQPTNPGAPTLLPNIGQSAHNLAFCTTGGSFLAIQVQLEASFDAITWFPIGNVGNSAGCSIIQAGGYFNNMRVNVVQFSFIGGSRTISAWYSGTAGPIALNPAAAQESFSIAQPITQCDQTILNSIANAGTALIAAPLTARGLVELCAYGFSFNGATAAGSVLIETGTGANCSVGTVVLANIFTTASTPQVLFFGSGSGTLVRNNPGNGLCVVNNSGATLEFEASSAQF
jgi:hypothetical protein